jgi:hypothetical protein
MPVSVTCILQKKIDPLKHNFSINNPAVLFPLWHIIGLNTTPTLGTITGSYNHANQACQYKGVQLDGH